MDAAGSWNLMCGRRCNNLLPPKLPLEEELQGKLHNARVVRAARPQEAAVRKATGIAGCVGRSGKTACRSIPGTVIAAEIQPLRMVEHVEGLGTEFKVPRFRFSRERETFEKAHIEIRPAGVVQNIALPGSEGQTLRFNECRWIVEKRTDDAGLVVQRRSAGVGIADRI